jgi:hypothetical protein
MLGRFVHREGTTIQNLDFHQARWSRKEAMRTRKGTIEVNGGELDAGGALT